MGVDMGIDVPSVHMSRHKLLKKALMEIKLRMYWLGERPWLIGVMHGSMVLSVMLGVQVSSEGD